MTDDRQSGVLFESWLKGTDPMPPNARPSVARVMARMPQTRQRGRWWPLPLLDSPAPIPTTNGRQPARGFTMLSALKFVVAAAIVALFGGFLLTGILTTPQGDEVLPAAVTESPSPMTTEELLSGMVTEEVEPGVLRVVNDGVRDLMRTYNIVVGMDGSVWGVRDQGFFRLGGEFTKWPGKASSDGFRVTPDGTIWVARPVYEWEEEPGKGTIRSFDGKRWKTHKTFPVNDEGGVEVGSDGTVWGWWPNPKDAGRWPDMVVARYGADGWQRHSDPIPHFLGLRVGSGDDVWVMYEGDDRREYLRQFVGGDWMEHEVPVSPGDWDIGPDGTAWARGSGEWRVDESGENVLDAEGVPIIDHANTIMRFDGDDWQEFGPGDGVPGMLGLRVAPDGSLWAAASEEEPGGLYHFHGDEWSQYLTDLGVDRFEFGPDGAVWLLGGLGGLDEDNWFDLYVITPEAVAATG